MKCIVIHSHLNGGGMWNHLEFPSFFDLAYGESGFAGIVQLCWLVFKAYKMVRYI